MAGPETAKRVVEETAATGDNIHLRAFDIDELRERFPQWDDLSNAGRYELLRSAMDEDTPPYRQVTPTDERHSHNITTIGLARTVVRCLDLNQQSPHIDRLVVGRETQPEPSFEDTELGDKTGDFPVTRVEDAGDALLVATFLSSTQGNGLTIREVGLQSDLLCNRALINPYEKSPGNAVIIEVVLQFIPGADVGAEATL